MKLVDAKATQSADLGSTFISHNQVTIDFNSKDLSLFSQMWHGIDCYGTKNQYTEEQIETLRELFGNILKNVSYYDLV